MSFHEYVRWISILLALGGFVTGMRAAILWMRASRLSPVPSWLIDEHSREPVDQNQSLAGWIGGITAAMNGSGRLNEIAAKWTAIAVGLSTSASLLGII